MAPSDGGDGHEPLVTAKDMVMRTQTEAERSGSAEHGVPSLHIEDGTEQVLPGEK